MTNEFDEAMRSMEAKQASLYLIEECEDVDVLAKRRCGDVILAGPRGCKYER